MQPVFNNCERENVVRQTHKRPREESTMSVIQQACFEELDSRFKMRKIKPLNMSQQAEEIVIRSVESQRKNPNVKKINWIPIVQEIKQTTGEIFSRGQLHTKYGLINPALNKGKWDEREVRILKESKKQGLSNRQIQEKIKTRSATQIRSKWKHFVAVHGIWSLEDDNRLKSVYDRHTGDISMVYQAFPERTEAQVFLRLAELKKLSDVEVFKADNLSDEQYEADCEYEILTTDESDDERLESDSEVIVIDESNSEEFDSGTEVIVIDESDSDRISSDSDYEILSAEDSEKESEDAQSVTKKWLECEDEVLILRALDHAERFEKVSEDFQNYRSAEECRERFNQIKGTPFFEKVMAEYEAQGT